MKLKAIFTVAIILILGLIIPSVNTQNLVVQSGQQLTEETVFPFINQKLKSNWWQYLRGANLLYRGSLDGSDRVLFLLIHRNIVGTFLSVVEWVKGQKQVKVQTLVRLGNGYGDDSEAQYGPVIVDPKSYSFKLEEGEFFIDTNEKGELQVNGQTVGEETNGSNGHVKTIDDEKKELSSKCVLLDSWIREHNWQYLREATNIHRSGRITNERFYCVYNYVNVVGTFFVLASTDIKTSQDLSIDTFVRLGDGYKKDSEALYKPVVFEPVILQFDLLN